MRISSKELNAFIADDPAWALRLREPCEVTAFADLARTSVAALSPHLIFAGRNASGFVLSVEGTRNLTRADCVCYGGFNGANSALRTLDGLVVKSSSDDGTAIYAQKSCIEGVVTGVFPGAIHVEETNISAISGVNVAMADDDGIAIWASNCHKLQSIGGRVAGAVVAWSSGLADISRLFIGKPDPDGIVLYAKDCENLQWIHPRFLAAGVDGTEDQLTAWTGAVDSLRKRLVRGSSFTMPLPESSGAARGGPEAEAPRQWSVNIPT